MAMRNTFDAGSDPDANCGSQAGIVDKCLGTAYAVVRAVYKQLPAITYLSGNIDPIVKDVHDSVDSAATSAETATTAAASATLSAQHAGISMDSAEAAAVSAAQSAANASAVADSLEGVEALFTAANIDLGFVTDVPANTFDLGTLV